MAVRRPNPHAERVLRGIIKPVETFLNIEASSGILLLIVTLIAMLWANSVWHESYEHLIHSPIGFRLGSIYVEHSLHHWVNDGLMVIFFFVVGLEIKRELVLGDLNTPQKAALPMFAALGGMLVPALIYTAFNSGGASLSGWGIPMATDIAFAVGVLSFLSRRVPLSIKVFLLALAIVDDLGAVLVIAVFYTAQVSQYFLGLAVCVFLLTYLIQLAGVRSFLVYVVLGVLAWGAVLNSGVHATIAGVILGLMTPVYPLVPFTGLVTRLRKLADDVDEDMETLEASSVDLPPGAEDKLSELSYWVAESKPPLDRLIHWLHPWVSYVIMPTFAFVNAGVDIRAVGWLELINHPIAIGVALGLVVGKPVGILAFSWLAVRLKLGRLPAGANWLHIAGVGCIAGIGFTMALFIGNLALKSSALELYSKVAILIASFVAATIGILALLMVPRTQSQQQ